MELPKRKPNRLKNYNYSQNGAYFITACIKNRQEMLWEVGARIARPQDTAPLSEYGIVINSAIQKIPEHYPSVSVDKYVVMPNHIHIILILSDGNGRAMRAPTIATVINQMKGYVTKQIGFSLWQKLYYDHIIRNQQEYQKIWDYIDTNPIEWENDCFYNPYKLAESIRNTGESDSDYSVPTDYEVYYGASDPTWSTINNLTNS